MRPTDATRQPMEHTNYDIRGQNASHQPSAANPIHQIRLTETISPRNPRTGQFDKAKKTETEGLIKQRTFRLVLREELPSRPDLVPSRFVLSIKRSDNGEEILKARFVLGGHVDSKEQHVVHNVTNVKQSSIRILIELTTALGFDI